MEDSNTEEGDSFHQSRENRLLPSSRRPLLKFRHATSSLVTLPALPSPSTTKKTGRDTCIQLNISTALICLGKTSFKCLYKFSVMINKNERLTDTA